MFNVFQKMLATRNNFRCQLESLHIVFHESYTKIHCRRYMMKRIAYNGQRTAIKCVYL